MRVPAGRRGSVVPDSGPAVTTSRVGPLPSDFRSAREGFGGDGAAGGLLRRAGGAPLDAGAVEVAAQDADDGEDEDPEQDEEPEPHDGEGQLAQHALTSARPGR